VDDQAVLEYLKNPDRGPADHNVDSVLEVLQRTDQPTPFAALWADWIQSGRFDGRDRPGDESAYILAACLSDGMKCRPEIIAPLLDVALARWRRQLGNSVSLRRVGVP